jgi:hypothetical protein
VPTVLAVVLAATPDQPAWIDAVLGPLGLLVFLLIAVVWGGSKGMWTWGWVHRELLAAERRRAEAAEKREAEWKLYALRALGATEEAAAVAKSAVEES